MHKIAKLFKPFFKNNPVYDEEHKMTKEQVKEAVELLGSYYGFEYDKNHKHKIIIYTDMIHDKNGDLIFNEENK